MEEHQAYQHPDKNKEADGWSILLGFLGLILGLVGGFVLFVSTYPFEGSSRIPVWQISAVDGTVIAIVGGLAYAFRKHSYFLRGILISAGMLFIVNGLCGLSGR